MEHFTKHRMEHRRKLMTLLRRIYNLVKKQITQENWMRIVTKKSHIIKIVVLNVVKLCSGRGGLTNESFLRITDLIQTWKKISGYRWLEEQGEWKNMNSITQDEQKMLVSWHSFLEVNRFLLFLVIRTGLSHQPEQKRMKTGQSGATYLTTAIG